MLTLVRTLFATIALGMIVQVTTASASPDVPKPIRDAVGAADRSEADRSLDAGRQPAEMLAFFGIEPGMRVAELAAGAGYTSELLARVVGPTGVVYGHNPPFVLQRFAEKPWTERLKKPVMANVKRLDREFDDPFPAGVKNLDAVLIVLFYHDTVWQGVDRGEMNRAIFAALKPGGVYGVVDHRARPEDGIEVTKSLHRIAEKNVREEIEKAGFRLVAEADFLANPNDPKNWNASPSAAGERRGTSDRFVLKFVKDSRESTVESR